MATRFPGGLRRLSQLEDYEVETGYPDVRGWRLEDQEGRDIGSVTDLLVDTARDVPVSVMIHLKDRNWFLELFSEEENGRLPLSAISLDEDRQVVRLTRPIEQVLQQRETVERPTAATTTGTTIGTATTPGAAETGPEETVDLVEEHLEVEKGREKAGEVRIGKAVEHETVHREVPVEREEVVVERERLDQPIAASEAAAHLEGRAGEVIVPIYREEVEVTTRPVVAERLRIRKRMVQETRDVTGEVRRERAVVEGTDPEDRPSGGGARRKRA
ncbi:MAG TPA: YsnF/AvaK domain-containing protein [Thermodesulfobacteriota bacterium]